MTKTRAPAPTPGGWGDRVQEEPEKAKLLPCPFCGESKLNICETDYNFGKVYAVTCRTFECHGVIFRLGYGLFDTEQMAVAAWNTRASAVRGEVMNREVDPADVWDAYCAEVPANRRSPQGALAFGFDAALRTPAAPPLVCGACGDIWQEGMSCGQKDNGHPFQTCYPVASAAPSDRGRVRGATDIVDEAACLIFAELCPGMVMGDEDRPHYENAAKAVLALSPSVGTSTHPSAEGKTP